MASIIASQIVDTVYREYPQYFSGVDKGIALQAIDNAVAKVVPDRLALSTVSPDYDSIILQLASALSESDAWKDIITSGTGQAILRFIASGIDLSLFSIERAVQEAYLPSASSQHSVNAAVNMLGVRVTRNLPGTISVKMSRPDSSTLFEIPAFSPFKIAGYDFYNTVPVIFPANMMDSYVTLTQGTVHVSTVQGTGLPNFELEIGDGTKDLTDNNIYVYVAGELWELDKERGPWNYRRNEKIAYDVTAPNGNVRINFGSGEFGAIPKANEDIRIVWCRTQHVLVPTMGADLAVSYNGPSLTEAVAGTTLSALVGAKQQQSNDYYKRYAPHIRAEEGRAVRRAGYPALAVKYPGVLDALFVGQAELGPHKRSMMNVIGATVLTETPMTSTQWSAFEAYIQDNSIFQYNLLRMDPVAVNIDIVANVYCKPSATLTYVKDRLTAIVQDAFKLKPGWLGYSLHLSDIVDMLEGTGELGGMVEYVKILSPTGEVEITGKNQYLKLNTLTLNMLYTSRDSLGGRGDLLRGVV